jgi:nicotinamidase-related amidase
MSPALLVIDVQKGMFAFPEYPAFNADPVCAAISDLVSRAREAAVPVIFVKHDEPGALAAGNPLHEVIDEIAPVDSEPVVTKTRNSAFLGTPLLDMLKERGIDHLVICGLQTDHCVDTTVRAAQEHGFTMTIAAGAYTTYDTPAASAETIIAHHERIWGGSFGDLVAAHDIDFQAVGAKT